MTLEQIAADFGVHAMTLSTWSRAADVEDGVKPGVTRAGQAERREARTRIRLLEQENEVPDVETIVRQTTVVLWFMD